MSTRSCNNTVGNLRASLATAHILSTTNMYRRIKVTMVSCAMQRNAAMTSEAPTSSCSTWEIAELKATREKATVTCDQLGCDMGVCY